MDVRNIKTLIIIGLFMTGPLVDHFVSKKQKQQDARGDQLVEAHECDPFNDCVADFNGDGAPARFEPSGGRGLVVFDGNKEALRLGFDSTDRTLRTHIAIHNENDRARLLVYDGVSYKTPLRAAYGWNGEKLVEVKPAGIEEEILSAMAAHEERERWDFRQLKRVLFLGFYWMAVVCVIPLIDAMFGRKSGALDPSVPPPADDIA